jgi:hypothetical protein
MYTKLLEDVRLYELLLRMDGDIAERARSEGCQQCRGALHSAMYPRKPRGAPCALPDGYDRRFSYCCAEEACRSRTTPPSVRFLGRRVYLSAVVVLASALQGGITPVRAARLRELLGASRQTLERWRVWWMEAFVESDFWSAARAHFSPPVDGGLPSAMLERFLGDAQDRLLALLRFMQALSTSAGYVPDRRD